MIKTKENQKWVLEMLVSKVADTVESAAENDDLTEKRVVSLKERNGSMKISLTGDNENLEAFGVVGDGDPLVQFRPGDTIDLELTNKQHTLADIQERDEDDGFN